MYSSLVPRPPPARVSLPSILCVILKVIRAGVGFGSGTETMCTLDGVHGTVNLALVFEHVDSN